jgi:hypothetical protein
MSDVTVDEKIEASPLALYQLVSDVTNMVRWSPETTACRWLDGATGPALGARFKGSNRDRWRRWSTRCTIVAADPGRRLAFDVKFRGIPIAQWAYEFESEGDGCRVIESSTERRPRWMRRIDDVVVMGVRDRAAHSREGMKATLAQLRRFAEEATTPAES